MRVFSIYTINYETKERTYIGKIKATGYEDARERCIDELNLMGLFFVVLD
jgi:hypothetical protein